VLVRIRVVTAPRGFISQNDRCRMTEQFCIVRLTNTKYGCDYTTAHTGHVMLQSSRASPSVVLKYSKLKDVFFKLNRVFVFEHHMESRFYLTCPLLACQKSRCFHDTGTPHRIALDVRKTAGACVAERGEHFQHLM
jgi:hypothetical protein